MDKKLGNLTKWRSFPRLVLIFGTSTSILVSCTGSSSSSCSFGEASVSLNGSSISFGLSPSSSLSFISASSSYLEKKN